MSKNTDERRARVNIDEVTFGVEIECFIPKTRIQAARISIGSHFHPVYLPTPLFPAHWKIGGDGSIEAPYCYDPTEIVSPPLKGLTGLREIERVVITLRNLNARINDSCGFHVHVGMQSILGERAASYELVVRWVRRVLNLASEHEQALLALTGNQSRMDNTYCDSIKRTWNDKLQTTDPIDKLREECGGTLSRYHTVNMRNLFDTKGTVEFRVFAATLNPIKLIGYVTAAMGICQRAAECPTSPRFNGERPTNPDWTLLVKAFHKAIVMKKYGFPSGAYAAFGKDVIANQIRNAGLFAQAEHSRD